MLKETFEQALDLMRFRIVENNIKFDISYQNLKCEKIRHNTICCNDEKYPEFYNKILKNKKKIRHEKLYRKDYKYNFVLTLDHNNKRVLGKGSCVFIHLTKNYKSTAGCVALKRDDFLILIRLVKKKMKILIK